MGSGNGIGTLRERSLHASLKEWLKEPGDAIEKQVDGYQIDIVRGELLIEIQTANFSAIKRKLSKLVEGHPVRLVYPVPRRKWIVRVDRRGRQQARRKSPKKGRVEDVFRELLRIPRLAAHPNLSLELLLIHEEEIWRDDGQGSWRRGHWSVVDRRLLEVAGRAHLAGREDYLKLLPEGLDDAFTNKDLAQGLGLPGTLAGKMSYCLRKMGYLQVVGKEGNAFVFERV